MFQFDLADLAVFFDMPKKFKYLKADFCNLVLASECTTSLNQFVAKSIDFDRLMTSEGTDTLILAGAICSA